MSIGVKALRCVTIAFYAVMFIVNAVIVYTNIPSTNAKPYSLIGHAYIQTPTAGIIHDFIRNRSFKDDPTFNFRSQVDSLITTYPARYLHMFQSVGSVEELRYVEDHVTNLVAADDYLAHASDVKTGVAKFMVLAADPIVVASIFAGLLVFSAIINAAANSMKRKLIILFNNNVLFDKRHE